MLDFYYLIYNTRKTLRCVFIVSNNIAYLFNLHCFISCCFRLEYPTSAAVLDDVVLLSGHLHSILQAPLRDVNTELFLSSWYIGTNTKNLSLFVCVASLIYITICDLHVTACGKCGKCLLLLSESCVPMFSNMPSRVCRCSVTCRVVCVDAQ